MYNKEFWDNVKINDVSPKSISPKSISVNKENINNGEMVRINTLRDYLKRKASRNDISIWEKSAYENTLDYMKKIWSE